MKNEKKQGRTRDGEFDWKRTDYGRMAFPDSTNYFGAITSIFKATKTASNAAGLRFWWEGLVQERGQAGAEAEKERVFSRGHRIDDTADLLIADYENYKYFRDDVVGKKGLPLHHSQIYLSAYVKCYDHRVLAFLAMNKIELICNEIPVWSRSRKAKGYTDMLFLCDDILYIVDFKGTTKKKKIDSAMLNEPAQQVCFYRTALVEMYNDAMNGDDDEAAELFEQIPGLTAELVNNSRALLLYFQDGEDAAQPMEFLTDEQRTAETDFGEFDSNIRKLPSWKDENKFLSIDWRMEQLTRRAKKYDSYPLVFLDQNEQGFFRRKWKRVQPGNIVEAEDFDKMLEHETEKLTNPIFGIDEAKINF